MIEFIQNAGGCVVSNNIMNRKGKLKWCVRDEPVHPADNGWRFFSDIDDDAYLSDAKNMSAWNYNSIAEIEPAILMIYNMPIGTDLVFMHENGERYFIDAKSGEKVDLNLIR